MMIEGDQGTKRLPITDGLRAVAVIAVVLFHTFPAAVPAGYIGVDIFFAISGFVIALNYLPRLISGEGSFGAFYARRIQRLVPAYIVLILVVSIAAYLILKPVDLRNFGSSLAMQAAYVQNISFWLQGDYFEDALHKPLLHTWSLAVEEQFYVCFPLLVLILRRWPRAGVALLWISFLASFAIGAKIAAVSPKTSFYLLPTRVWELVAGIGVALAWRRWTWRRAADPIMLLALAAIVFACIGFDESARFPGMHSFLAVGATALICLVQADVGPYVGAILSNRLAQHFGRISYSWYLWHWPLISLNFLYNGRPASLWERLVLLALGYLLAVASYTWVEAPILARRAFRQRAYSLSLLGAFLGAALTIGGYLTLTDGALNRYRPAEANLFAATMDRPSNRCSFLARFEMYEAQVCRLTDGRKTGVLLLGDSHADFMKTPLSSIASSHDVALYLTKQDCRPVDYAVDYNCGKDVWNQVKTDVRRLNISAILVIARWERSMSAGQYESGIRRMMETGVPIYVQKVVPNGPYFNPARRISEEHTLHPFTHAQYDADYAVQNRTFKELAARYPGRLYLVDPVPLLCPGGDACLRDIDGTPAYIDDDHLSTPGRRRLALLYRSVFDSIAGSRDPRTR